MRITGIYKSGRIIPRLVLVAFLSYLTGIMTLPDKYRTGAICWDGTVSSATGRGACSHHGGVKQWTYGESAKSLSFISTPALYVGHVSLSGAIVCAVLVRRSDRLKRESMRSKRKPTS